MYVWQNTYVVAYRLVYVCSKSITTFVNNALDPRALRFFLHPGNVPSHLGCHHCFVCFSTAEDPDHQEEQPVCSAGETSCALDFVRQHRAVQGTNQFTRRN